MYEPTTLRLYDAATARSTDCHLTSDSRFLSVNFHKPDMQPVQTVGDLSASSAPCWPYVMRSSQFSETSAACGPISPLKFDSVRWSPLERSTIIAGTPSPNAA